MHEVIRALKYSSTMPVRVIIALSNILWIVSLALAAPEWHVNHVYDVMRNTAPRSAWIALFAADALCIVWRIFDSQPRVHLARLINAYSFGLWLSTVIALTVGLGYPAPPITTNYVICLMCAWLTLRTEFTHWDRESA